MRHMFGSMVAVVLATSTASGQFGTITPPPVAREMAETTIVSKSLRFEGKVVEQRADGTAVREIAYMRGRKFVWQGRLGERVAAKENPVDDGGRSVAIEQMTRDELARELRGLALFDGHQFVEDEPA